MDYFTLAASFPPLFDNLTQSHNQAFFFALPAWHCKLFTVQVSPLPSSAHDNSTPTDHFPAAASFLYRFSMQVWRTRFSAQTVECGNVKCFWGELWSHESLWNVQVSWELSRFRLLKTFKSFNNYFVRQVIAIHDNINVVQNINGYMLLNV